jgi:hypothetical protein
MLTIPMPSAACARCRAILDRDRPGHVTPAMAARPAGPCLICGGLMDPRAAAGTGA